MKRIVILYSGGLDSRVMTALAAKNEPDAVVTLLYFDLGHAYAAKEKAALPPDTDIRRIDWMPEGRDKGNGSGGIHIPGRNMVLAALAASIHTPDEVWMGALKGEDHAKATDKNARFRRLMNKTMGYVLSPFSKTRLRFPFIEQGWDKLDMTRWAVEHGGLTPEELRDTSSCMSATTRPCGACVVCWRRWGIFRQLGIEPDDFLIDPERTDGLWAMVEAMLTGDHYDGRRRREIIPVVREFGDGFLKERLSAEAMFVLREETFHWPCFGNGMF